MELAWQADDVSAFGSVIAVSGMLTKDSAAFFEDRFVEVVLAPDFDVEFLEFMKLNRKNVRLLKVNYSNDASISYRSVGGDDSSTASVPGGPTNGYSGIRMIGTGRRAK